MRLPSVFSSPLMRPALAALVLLATPAGALEVIHPGGFPTPIGPVATEITHLYNIIFLIIAVTAVAVAVPILYILWRFRRAKVAQPATFSHSTVLELAWTAIPALLCFFIAWESYQAMVRIRTMPTDGTNIEVVAYQFGWDFYYPDASRDGVHVAAAEPTSPDPFLSSAGQERLVKELVVPAGKPIVLHVTAADVIHAFFVPHLGVKIDAMPGRINYAWFEASAPGTYLGQCAELCGAAHSEMFFRVKVVTPEAYAAYIAERQQAAGLSPAAAVVSETAIVSGTLSVGSTPSQTAPSAPVSATVTSPSA